MCGRYIIREAAKAEKYWEQYGMRWTASYNVAPTQQVPILRWRKDAVEATTVRWGLIPFFARGEPPKYSTINARIETFETAASYKGPWQRGQRCLQIASGFYEWHLDAAGRKTPYFIHLADQQTFAFAGLWDRSFKADGTVIESCVHLTMPANELMRQVHNTGNNPYRMPAILRREDHEAWLHGSAEEARAVLAPYSAGLMVAYAVGPRVNSPKNDDEQLIEPAEDSTPA